MHGHTALLFFLNQVLLFGLRAFLGSQNQHKVESHWRPYEVQDCLQEAGARMCHIAPALLPHPGARHYQASGPSQLFAWSA